MAVKLTSKEFTNAVNDLPNVRNFDKEIGHLVKEYDELHSVARNSGARRLPTQASATLKILLMDVAQKKPAAEDAARKARELYLAMERLNTALVARNDLNAKRDEAIQKLRAGGAKGATTGEAMRLVLTTLQKAGAEPTVLLSKLIDQHKQEAAAQTATKPKMSTTEWGTFKASYPGALNPKQREVLRTRGDLAPSYTRLLDGVIHASLRKEGKK